MEEREAEESIINEFETEKKEKEEEEVIEEATEDIVENWTIEEGKTEEIEKETKISSSKNVIVFDESGHVDHHVQEGINHLQIII